MRDEGKYAKFVVGQVLREMGVHMEGFSKSTNKEWVIS